VANEIICHIKRRKEECVILKVDFEKVCDSVNWDFLIYMTRRLGFLSNWIMWIRGCLESSIVSDLVNGSPTEEFKLEKVLRHGDPLTPFLFLVVSKSLVGTVRQAENKNMLHGVKVGQKEININMLQFAYDTLFICKPPFENILVIKSMLRCFELASSVKVNFNKTKLGGFDVLHSKLLRFSEILNFRTMNIPFIYLGMPIGGNHRRRTFLEGND